MHDEVRPLSLPANVLLSIVTATYNVFDCKGGRVYVNGVQELACSTCTPDTAAMARASSAAIESDSIAAPHECSWPKVPWMWGQGTWPERRLLWAG